MSISDLKVGSSAFLRSVDDRVHLVLYFQRNAFTKLSGSCIRAFQFQIMLKEALVVFPSEKNGRFVVDISAIKDFRPISTRDFDKNRLYKVRWQNAKAMDSSSPASNRLYDAYILLLAGEFRYFNFKLSYPSTVFHFKTRYEVRVSLSGRSL